MADRAGYDQPENKHISNYPTSREGTLPSYQVIGTQQQTGFFQPSVPYQSAHVTGHLYTSKLSTTAFVPVDARFQVVKNADAKQLIERLQAVMKAYDVEYGCEMVETDQPASSTPKGKLDTDNGYVCKFKFHEQIEIFRSLHENPGAGFLNSSDPFWRRRSLRAMKLKDTQKVYFGGKFREAISVSCLPTSCYNLVMDLVNKYKSQGVPELINSGLFKELPGYRDEEKLRGHLTALLDGSLSRKDFGKSLQADKKRAKEAATDEVVTQLRRRLELCEEEKQMLERKNKELEEKLANCTCDVFAFKEDSPVRSWNRLSLPKVSSEEDSSFSTEYSLDLNSDMYGRSPSPLKEVNDKDSELNKKFIKKKGPLQLFSEKISNTVKRKASKLQSDTASTSVQQSRTKREKKEVFTVGEKVEALWVDKKPQLTEWYAAVIQAVVVTGESYRVRFLDDNIVKIVKLNHLRKV